MLWFLGLAAGIWAFGGHRNWPRQARWQAIALLYVAFLILLAVAPGGAAMMGGSFAEWAVLGLLAALVWAYSAGLSRMRARADEANPPATKPEAMGDVELERYARHIMLRELGGLGQRRLKEAKVLVIGAGGLGAPALLYLAAAGVGRIGVIDEDEVENSNLQRQVIHRDQTIGMAKVFSAKEAMTALNPYVDVRPYRRRFDADCAEPLASDYDLILDGSDNFATRRLANKTATALKIPLVSGAIAQWEGQVTVYDPASDAPCFACVFPEDPAPGLVPTCAEAGVVAPLPGVIGSIMATEAIKLLTNAGQPLRGEMLLYDALYGETRKITLKRRADCPVCGASDA